MRDILWRAAERNTFLPKGLSCRSETPFETVWAGFGEPCGLHVFVLDGNTSDAGCSLQLKVDHLYRRDRFAAAQDWPGKNALLQV